MTSKEVFLPKDHVAFKEIVETCYQNLSFLGQDSAQRESWILLSWVLGKTKLDYILDPNLKIKTDKFITLKQALKRRINGEPLYRILGTRSFYGREFILDQDVLEPRDDTEILAHSLILLLQNFVDRGKNPYFLDFGTGSGILAITGLCAVSEAKAMAVDISENALSVAKQNALKHQVQNRFQPLLSNGFNNIKETFDIIVSNPPYIPTADIEQLENNVRCYDPITALDGGADGLSFYRLLAKKAKKHLIKGGYLAMEIGYNQEEAIQKIFSKQDYYFIDKISDLQKINRVLIYKNTNAC